MLHQQDHALPPYCHALQGKTTLAYFSMICIAGMMLWLK
jgi:hypothetical protein